jgi:hypothetical protein
MRELLSLVLLGIATACAAGPAEAPSVLDGTYVLDPAVILSISGSDTLSIQSETISFSANRSFDTEQLFRRAGTSVRSDETIRVSGRYRIEGRRILMFANGTSAELELAAGDSVLTGVSSLNHPLRYIRLKP